MAGTQGARLELIDASTLQQAGSQLARRTANRYGVNGIALLVSALRELFVAGIRDGHITPAYAEIVCRRIGDAVREDTSPK